MEDFHGVVYFLFGVCFSLTFREKQESESGSHGFCKRAWLIIRMPSFAGEKDIMAPLLIWGLNLFL